MDEADQEVMMMDHVQLVVNKGKRTKRQRPCSPFTPSLMNTSSSSSDHEGSLEFTDSTEEEEDMANCLILLAQGQGLADHHRRRHHPKRIIQDSGGGGYVYKCKTCNRCFPSFQALGGHRASHKKPKNSVVEEKVKPLMLLEDDQIDHNSTTPCLSLHLGNRTTSPSNVNKSKVHECSICGSEFSSGQALGGHMRRHRPSMATTTSDHHQSHHQEVVKKERNNILSLDLNLPAPEDDRETKFAFSAKHEPPLVFSSSALVDCHY